MCSTEIWYLWYIFYTKFVYILCKFYLVQSFDYSWNNNLIVLLCKGNMFFTWKLCFVIEPLSSDQYSKYKQCSFLNPDATPMNKHDFHFQPNTKVETALTYRRWINVILSMLFQRCFINVGTMSINIRRVNFHFQPNFTIKTTLFYRRWVDVVLSTLFQRYFANIETTSINVRQLNSHFQPNINVETTLMNVDDISHPRSAVFYYLNNYLSSKSCPIDLLWKYQKL